MNVFLKFLLLAVIAIALFSILMLIFSFVEASFNFIEWKKEVRCVLMVLWSGLFTVCFLLFVKEEKEEKEDT